MNEQNYYTILGVKPTASLTEIKKAYKGLSMKYHPDKNIGNNANDNKYKSINEAYSVLKDETLKHKYDISINPVPITNPIVDILPANFKQMFNDMMSESDNKSVNAIISELSNHIHNEFIKPPTISKVIEFELHQIMKDQMYPLQIEKWVIVNNVKGTEVETIYITVPSGIDNNEVIVLPNKGNTIECNMQTMRGDIRITVKIVNNTFFERKGLDLYYTQTITLKEALTGFAIVINHPNGNIYRFINSQIITPIFTKRINNLGISRYNYIGSLIMSFNITFPTTLTNDQVLKLKDIL